MQTKIAEISPVVSSFKIISDAVSTPGPIVTLNNTVVGTTSADYMASQSLGFYGAVWQPYSTTPSFTLRSRYKTVYFKVKDGSGTESAVVTSRIPISM